MADSYMGQVMMTGFGFAPRGFAFCNGALLPIQQNQALFALLGVNYGGNGAQNFALPNLQGRTPVGAGSSADSAWQPSAYRLGTPLGVENVSLSSDQLPPHNHLALATTQPGAGRSPAGGLAARSSHGVPAYAAPGPLVGLANTGQTGGGAPHNNMQPFSVISFSIALSGAFPSRN
ncbi:Phage Tail Collar Domain protein [compost metagenome]